MHRLTSLQFLALLMVLLALLMVLLALLMLTGAARRLIRRTR